MEVDDRIHGPLGVEPITEEVDEEVVVAPGRSPLAGETGNEQVPPVQLVEHSGCIRTPRDGGAHLSGEFVEDRGLEQEAAQVRWLRVEHLLSEEAPEVGLGGPDRIHLGRCDFGAEP
jgi:hypothetical protein